MAGKYNRPLIGGTGSDQSPDPRDDRQPTWNESVRVLAQEIILHIEDEQGGAVRYESPAMLAAQVENYRQKLFRFIWKCFRNEIQLFMHKMSGYVTSQFYNPSVLITRATYPVCSRCSHNCRVSWECPACRPVCARMWSSAQPTLDSEPSRGETRFFSRSTSCSRSSTACA